MSPLKNVTHGFAPVFDGRSKVLVLGTMPSPMSRESGFYYGHRQNRFWRVMAHILDESEPRSIEEKRGMLTKNGVALWDVLQSCDIDGASDGSIRNAVANDIGGLVAGSYVQAIFFNGMKAAQLFKRLCPDIGLPAYALPSTSPANMAYSFERLCAAYEKINEYLQ